MSGELHVGDCIDVMLDMSPSSIDLVYLDPPFCSGRDYVGDGVEFSDRGWGRYFLPASAGDVALIAARHHSLEMGGYVQWLGERLWSMKRLMKPTASIYLHCDPTAGAYLKVLMDGIFGRAQFRNEIVWCYTGQGRPKRHFTRKHDVILFYSSGKENTFNRKDVLVPYVRIDKRKRVVGSDVVRPPEEADLWDGRMPRDWWDEFAPSFCSSKEFIGYPTQKPLSLLERIIKASSNEGDVVLDPFCGCATTCVAAERLNRRWVGIDINPKAVALAEQRLRESV